MSFRAGYVAVVGRPNVGKSTLTNALVGQKISAVSPKPETTRHRILGIVAREFAQIVLIDTPGMHGKTARALARYLTRTAGGALLDADAVLLVVEATRFGDSDATVLARAIDAGKPIVVALNKIDEIADKTALLPLIDSVAARHSFAAVVPISARRRDGLDALAAALIALLPTGEPIFDLDEVTDKSERFIAGELIREQVMRQLDAELPYAAAVVVDAFERDGALTRITATVFVERESQKGIVIGAGGARLKSIGSAARVALEKFVGGKVYLDLVVRVRDAWSDDEQALRQLGYT